MYGQFILDIYYSPYKEIFTSLLEFWEAFSGVEVEHEAQKLFWNKPLHILCNVTIACLYFFRLFWRKTNVFFVTSHFETKTQKYDDDMQKNTLLKKWK